MHLVREEGGMAKPSASVFADFTGQELEWHLLDEPVERLNEERETELQGHIRLYRCRSDSTFSYG